MCVRLKSQSENGKVEKAHIFFGFAGRKVGKQQKDVVQRVMPKSLKLIHKWYFEKVRQGHDLKMSNIDVFLFPDIDRKCRCSSYWRSPRTGVGAMSLKLNSRFFI